MQQEQPLWTTGMAERQVEQTERPAAEPVHVAGPRWFSILALFAFLLALRYVVPYLAEEVSYSINRGKERAAYEVATTALKTEPFTGLNVAYQSIAKRISPSVVHINVLSVRPDRLGDGYVYNRIPTEAQQGSGVIMDKEGYIVTNYHVVRNGAEIEVSLSDGRRVFANVVGADPLTDIAVIKINTGKLIAAEWGDSDRLEVGSLVWALGSPFGLKRSVTHGILSAKNRSDFTSKPHQDFLQTDTAVNPGNSGGPLVDVSGNVIGINTAIVGESYQGISFAVPSSVARRVYERLVEDGHVERGWLGVRMTTATRQTEEGPVSIGAFIREVIPEVNGSRSPARVSGILPGDLIVGWNDKQIRTQNDLSRAVAATPVGESATVLLIRDGREMKLQLNVAMRPANVE